MHKFIYIKKRFLKMNCKKVVFWLKWHLRNYLKFGLNADKLKEIQEVVYIISKE